MKSAVLHVQVDVPHIQALQDACSLQSQKACIPVSPAKEQCLCAALCRPPDVTHPTDQLLHGLQIQTCRAQGSNL